MFVATGVFAQAERGRQVDDQPRPTAPIVVYAGASEVPLDRLRFATPEQHVYRLLLGDLRVLPFIENADVSIVPVIEAALKQVTGVTMDEVDALVRQLSAAKWVEREQACWRLLGAPAEADELLRRYLDETGSPEVRHRLASVMEVRKACGPGFEAAGKLLLVKYQQHAEALFQSRWRLLQDDPRHVDAMNYFAYVPFEGVWPLIESRDPGDQLRFLLLRVRMERRGRDVDAALRKHTAGALLRVAKQTYWPVEVEPVQIDGEFGWTTLVGSVNGNVVDQVLRVSLKTASFSKPAERGEWVNLITWQRWTYIFRFTQAWHKKNAVVYAERQGAGELPFGLGNRPRTDAQADTVRDWPAEVTVPYVTITERESTDWHHMRAYEWARPLFPESIRKQVLFRENAYEPPAIIAAAEFEAGNRE
jgi:hypothetical protein